MFFSRFSITITSLGEESTFRTFVWFVLVCFCLFPLPLGVWEGLRFVIVALPGLFSYLFFHCPELEIHTMGGYNWIESWTNPHWEIWACERCNSPPIDPKTILSWEVCSIARDCLLGYWICLGYDEFWVQCHVPGTNEGLPIPLHNHMLGECVPPCLLIWDHCCLFVYVEVLRPSQPNGVMSSAISLPNHTFTGQA